MEAENARRRIGGLTVLLAVGLIGLGGRSVSALICDSPDKLCVGDPCEIRSATLADPCEVDFGDRHVVVAGTLRTEDGGKIAFSARSFDVRRAIVARPAQAATSLGGTIELRATDDINIRWRLDVSGQKGAGSILLDAGDNIEIRAPLRASATGTGTIFDGGTIDIHATGLVSTVGRARIQARSGVNRRGGLVTISGDEGVRLSGVVDARGGEGGSIRIDSSAGDVVIMQKLDASGRSKRGGVVLLSAARVLRTDRRIDANGATVGGFVALSGQDTLSLDLIRARSGLRDAQGGTVWLFGQDSLFVRDTIFVDGAEGGHVALGGGSLEARGRIVATGKVGSGGGVAISAGDTIVDASISTGGRTDGGEITIDVGSLRVDRRTSLLAQGMSGGSIAVNADDAVFESRVDVRADGEDGSGTIRIETEGDLLMRSDFRVRGGGTIVAKSRNGSLTADGDFQTDGLGCIAIDAGGTIEISDAEFDAPVFTSCP